MRSQAWPEIRSLFLAELREKERETSSGIAGTDESSASLPKAVSEPKGSLPFYAADPEIARIVLTKAAELWRQPGFRANSSPAFGLAYMVHHVLQFALKEEIVLPPGIDYMAANHFVEAVFSRGRPTVHGTGRESGPLHRNRTHQSRIELPEATPRRGVVLTSRKREGDQSKSSSWRP